MKWTQKALAAFLAAAMAVTMAAPAFAKTDKNDLRYLDIVDSDGENAYYDRTDTIKPGDKYYIIIGKSTGTKLDNLLDKDLFSFKLKKQNGGKYISGAEITEKRFGNTRYICIEFDAKDNFTDEENKVTLEAIFKAKQDLAASNPSGIANGDFPIFVPATSGANSTSAAKALADYNTAHSEYTAAEAARAAAETAYNDALKAQSGVTAAQQTKTNIKNKYASEANGATVDVDWLTNKATEARNNATNAKNAAALSTAYDALKSAWTNWSDAYGKDSSLDGNSNEFQALSKALTTYQNALVLVTVPTTVAEKSYIKDISSLVLPANFPNVTFGDTSTTEPYLQLWNAVNTTGPYYDQELTYIQAVQAACGTESDWTQEATDYSKDATDLKTAIDTINSSSQNNVADLKADLDKKTTEANSKKAAMDTAKRVYDDIVSGTSSDLFLAKNDTYSFEFTVWIQNERQEDDDANFVAGEKGVVIRPVKNETNTITWENSDRTLARLTFQADSDTDYLCPRLSTRWSNEDYYNFFDDQDAYLFDFVSNPDIPAQTRGTLELYNPFLDRDGDYYRDVRDLYLYQVVDGILKEVDFDPVLENDDGEEVLRLRTRTLGTYVVCEDPLDLDDLYGDEDKDDNKKPYIIIDANQKPVPNTGR